MCNKQVLEELNQKFLDGDGISDEELDKLLELYSATTEALSILGAHFHLSWRESYSRLLSLEAYKQARGRG